MNFSNNRLYLLSIFLIALFLANSCTSIKTPQEYIKTTSTKNPYTASFPLRNVSNKLRLIKLSITRVVSQSVYTMYRFKNNSVTMDMIQQAGGPAQLLSIQSTYHDNRAGTAVCILNDGNHAAFITAGHILEYPDTLISYRHGKNIPDKKYVTTMGIKQTQQNYTIVASKIIPVDILATGKNRRDIGLLIASEPGINLIPPLPISIGNAKKLKLGSFIYILGYPLGAPVVTRAIVSDPDYDSQGSFLTDAVSNHGISGGLIIATNDDYKSFEWVGMAVAAFASQRLYLVPKPSGKNTYWNHQVYTDTIYVSKKRTIDYGLMNAVPVNEIIFFLYKHSDKLNDYGLNIKNI